MVTLPKGKGHTSPFQKANPQYQSGLQTLFACCPQNQHSFLSSHRYTAKANEVPCTAACQAI